MGMGNQFGGGNIWDQSGGANQTNVVVQSDSGQQQLSNAQKVVEERV
jgi:hypothetical protein